MLKHGDINPLNVFGLRELDHCAPHFYRVCFDLKTSEKKIKDWIYENLEGRFWMGDVYIGSVLQKCVAFEVPAESSYFALLLDQINQADFTDLF